MRRWHFLESNSGWMSSACFQSGCAPCDFHLRSFSYVLLLMATINYLSILFSKCLLKLVCLQFCIEEQRSLPTRQCDRKSWDVIAWCTAWCGGFFCDVNSCMLVLLHFGAFFYYIPLVWSCASHVLLEWRNWNAVSSSGEGFFRVM